MGFCGLLRNPHGITTISGKFLMRHKTINFPGIAPGLFAMRGGGNMVGKTLNLKIYVTGENLEKLERIREYLNNKNDVQSGDVERWKKSDVYTLLFNDAIKNYKL